MTTPLDRRPFFSRPAERIAAVLACAVVAVMVADLAGPAASRAQHTPGVAPAVHRTTAAAPEPRILAQLVGPEFIVQAVAAPGEPLYNVLTLDGELLQGGMLASDVYRSFPMIELDSMFLEPAPAGDLVSGAPAPFGPLMMVDVQ